MTRIEKAAQSRSWAMTSTERAVRDRLWTSVSPEIAASVGLSIHDLMQAATGRQPLAPWQIETLLNIRKATS